MLNALVVFSQSKITSYELTSKDQVGLASSKKDTLYLINDELGLAIKNSWFVKDSSGRDLYAVKPFFVLLPKDKFVRKLNSQILAEKTKTKNRN